MNDLKIISGTDGSYITMNCIKYLFKLLRQFNSSLANYKFIILYPNYLTKSKIHLVRQEFSNEILYGIDIERNMTDIYYVKLIISEFLKRSDIKFDDSILYLDYDHFSVNPLELPPIKDNTIFLSSETSKLSISNISNCIGDDLLQNLDAKFYNTSFIYGKCGDILKATEKWKEFYNILNGRVPIRHLEEIAFTIAAIASGVRVKPVSSKVQSNFAIYQNNCSLFHFGGETMLSYILKKSFSLIEHSEFIPPKA